MFSVVIHNVEIDDSFLATRNEIYQLMGRAGRRGKKSFNAMVIFRDMFRLRMVMNSMYVDVEAMSAEMNFQRIILS
mgnify:CR=1 FL=1